MGRKRKEISTEKKLRILYNLQLIDSKIDSIKSMRGELPKEVESLDIDIENLSKQLEKITAEISELEYNITKNKNAIVDANTLIAKYEDKLKNVRNNREYNSLVKEQEYQKLEIEFYEKKNTKLLEKIESKTELVPEIKEAINTKKNYLNIKKKELDSIISETIKDEELLLEESKKIENIIENELLESYKRIRKKVNNGLAVVSVENEAANGSFFIVPPQIQIEIKSREQIIKDEHSGRILIDEDLAKEETAKINSLIKKIEKKEVTAS